MELPSLGIGTLDVMERERSPALVLTLVRRRCGDSEAGESGLVTLSRTPNRWLFEVRRPGFYFFRVANRDPQQLLERYTLNARFVPLPSSVLDRLPQPGADFLAARRPCLTLKGGEDDEVIEIDPDALRSEPEPGCTESWADEVLEIDSGPASAPSVLVRSVVRRLCQRPASDDHGDTALCATPIQSGVEMTGAVHNSRGDDADVFAFMLDGTPGTLWTVDLTTRGETDTFGALYDQHGYRLGQDDDGGLGTNFRIFRNLLPGRYFVRVEGRHRAEGPYRLRVAAYSSP